MTGSFLAWVRSTVRCEIWSLIWHRVNLNVNFTFSEPCIVMHIRETDQQDAHLFSLIYSNWTILYMFRTNYCSSSGGYFCTRRIQYFSLHLWGCMAANKMWLELMHGKILNATCTEITLWWWTIVCSKHIEDSWTGKSMHLVGYSDLYNFVHVVIKFLVPWKQATP